MSPENENKPKENKEETTDNSVILTEENAAVVIKENAEADEDDIELIDLTKEQV